MEYTTLDGSDLEVSRIGLGTWAIGGWMWGGSDEAEALRTIHTAVDLGITLIDTAPVYGFGASEEIVGKALSQGGIRDRVVLATKVGLQWSDGKVWRNSSRHRIMKEIDDSLRRLGTDRIDLYQVHWPDPAVPIEETAAAMQELLQAGKVRALGVSNYDPDELHRFAGAAPLHAHQPPYNLFERGIEADVLPAGRELGLATLAYGALCRGLLSGKITSETSFRGDDLRRSDPKFQQDRRPQYLEAVARLDALARERYGKPVLSLAVRWLLDRPGVTVALWGARRPDQLDALGDVLGWSLEDEGMEAVDSVLAETVHDAVGPEFMAPPRTRPERARTAE
jgi:aryl-alcohol dehydrogenase-like predicted oxidoreductase